jgi:hypothetical protein
MRLTLIRVINFIRSFGYSILVVVISNKKMGWFLQWTTIVDQNSLELRIPIVKYFYTNIQSMQIDLLCKVIILNIR